MFRSAPSPTHHRLWRDIFQSNPNTAMLSQSQSSQFVIPQGIFPSIGKIRICSEGCAVTGEDAKGMTGWGDDRLMPPVDTRSTLRCSTKRHLSVHHFSVLAFV